MYGWDQWDITLREMQMAFDFLSEKFSTRQILLAGASQGANVALKVALTEMLPVQRLILTIPAIKNQEHLSQLLGEKETFPRIPTLIITGEKDHFLQGALELQHFLKNHGLPVYWHLLPNVGHFSLLILLK